MIQSLPPGLPGELLPPPELQDWVGSGGAHVYKAVGAEFLGYLVDLCGLQPGDAVLDVGCGSGRMALPLTDYLKSKGRYAGFDVSNDAIAWCTENISGSHPNFSFTVVDIQSGRYNPGGRYRASDFRFPYSDGSFDVVLLASVFTHMLPSDMKQYMNEIFRVLKPGGRSLVTFFLLNEESLALNARGEGDIKFDHEMPGFRTANIETPEAAIAYPEAFVRDMYGTCGLEIREPLRYGKWCGRSDGMSGQDIVIALKPRANSIAFSKARAVERFGKDAIATGSSIRLKDGRGGKANDMGPRLPPREFFRAFSAATKRPVDFGDLQEPAAHFICKLDSYLSWKSWVNGVTLAESMQPLLHGSLLSYANQMLQHGYFGRFGGTVSPCSYMLNFPASQVSLLWIPKNSCTAIKKTLAQFEPVERTRRLRGQLFHETCQTEFGVSPDDYARAKYFVPTLAVVRDPYERLASCYLDKFVNPIVRGTVFEGFIAAHIKNARRTLRISNSSASLTFNQFVSYVWSAEPFLHDPHWRPQSNFFGTDRSLYKIIPIEHISTILDLVGKAGTVSTANKSFGKKFTLDRVGKSQYGDLEPERFSEIAIADYADLFDVSTFETVSTLYGDDVTLYRAAQAEFSSK